MNGWYDMAKNWYIQSNISGYTGPILAVFSQYESVLGADDGSVPYFPMFQGTLLCNQIILRECYQCRLIPLALLH